MKRVGGLLGCAVVAAGAIVFLSAGATPARADCFEDIGCTDSDRFDIDDLVELSCENLWYVRNSIYDENGYCFQTARGRREFDNSDCWVRNQSKVKLSQIERHNVNQIVEAESENGCR